METPEFAAGIARLLELTSAVGPAAIMCAEAVWWSCHRALISDYLKARDWEVLHIVAAKAPELHPFTSAARIVYGQLSYTSHLAL